MIKVNTSIANINRTDIMNLVLDFCSINIIGSIFLIASGNCSLESDSTGLTDAKIDTRACKASTSPKE